MPWKTPTRRGPGVTKSAELPGPPPPQAFRTVLGSLLLLAGIFFLNFIVRVGMGPLMPAIEGDLGLSHGSAGSLFLFLSLGYCVGLLGSGWVASLLTHRWTVVFSSVAVGIGLLATSLGAGIASLRSGMVFLGVSAGLYLPSGVATITALVAPRDWGKALAVHELAPNLSFVAAPLLVEVLLRAVPWTGVLALFGVTAVGGGLLFARFGRGGAFRGTPPGVSAVRSALADPSLWILAALFTLALGASLGVYTMLPLFLVSDAGLERTPANTLIAASRLSGLATVFVAGWLSDRLGARRTLALVFGIAGTLTTLLGVASGPWLLAVVFLQPTLAVCFFPVGFAVLSRINPLGVSLVIPGAILVGGGGIPALMGAMADAGAFREAMVLVGVLILGGAALATLVRVPAGGERA